MLINFALKGQWIKIANRFALPFQGDCLENFTHRVAVGCYALPLKGRRKKLVILM
jgi:hypothetical protein